MLQFKFYRPSYFKTTLLKSEISRQEEVLIFPIIKAPSTMSSYTHEKEPSDTKITKEDFETLKELIEKQSQSIEKLLNHFTTNDSPTDSSSSTSTAQSEPISTTTVILSTIGVLLSIFLLLCLFYVFTRIFADHVLVQLDAFVDWMFC